MTANKGEEIGMKKLLALGLLVRLALIAATDDYKPLYDSADFDRHARSIADGDGRLTSLARVADRWFELGEDEKARKLCAEGLQTARQLPAKVGLGVWRFATRLTTVDRPASQ